FLCDPPSHGIYTLPLHDALPILVGARVLQRFLVEPEPIELVADVVVVMDVAPRLGQVGREPAAASLDPARDAPLLVERAVRGVRSEEHTSELQSRENLVCRLLLE